MTEVVREAGVSCPSFRQLKAAGVAQHWHPNAMVEKCWAIRGTRMLPIRLRLTLCALAENMSMMLPVTVAK
jgi:hypothetical protein